VKMIKLESGPSVGIYPVEINGLRDMQREVNGHIEIVNILGREFEGTEMIVNDEGLLLGLTLNPLASMLYGFEQHGQVIVGSALIGKNGFDEYGEPDIVGFSDAEAAEVMAKIDAYIQGLL